MEDEQQYALLWKAAVLERQVEELQQHLVLISREIDELHAFYDHLKRFSESWQNEMFSSLGKGIHVKAKGMDRHLFVEVGAGVVVKKTPAETQVVIDGQVKRLHEAKFHVLQQLEARTHALQEVAHEIEQLSTQQKSS